MQLKAYQGAVLTLEAATEAIRAGLRAQSPGDAALEGVWATAQAAVAAATAGGGAGGGGGGGGAAFDPLWVAYIRTSPSKGGHQLVRSELRQCQVLGQWLHQQEPQLPPACVDVHQQQLLPAAVQPVLEVWSVNARRQDRAGLFMQRIHGYFRSSGVAVQARVPFRFFSRVA